MPTCFKSWGLITYDTPQSVVLTKNRTDGGRTLISAMPLVPDSAITDPALCSVVAITGPEYQALLNRIVVLEGKPSSSTGESTVNVTADIFVGAALVCIFVLGWIAGAQR